jgi:hypothetical protein
MLLLMLMLFLWPRTAPGSDPVCEQLRVGVHRLQDVHEMQGQIIHNSTVGNLSQRMFMGFVTSFDILDKESIRYYILHTILL